MKHFVRYSLLYAAAGLFIIGCSTKNNTWISRNGNAFITYFNIYFNAQESYNEGIENIYKAQKDNYAQILNMYPISVHDNAKAGESSMNTTIEKCRKAIKLRSIKVKPARNYKKRQDPKYIAFMNQEEYNPYVSKSWLLQAKAEFHKGDFLGAVGTYSYIINHFGWEPEIMAEAHIGRARCYKEMGWNYEAEDALNKISKKITTPYLNGIFAGANADLLIQEQRYKEAIPFLQIAIKNESNGKLKTRFRFVLGQIAAITGDKTLSYQAFTSVIKSSAPYEMDFAARLQRAQVSSQDPAKVVAELTKLAKSSKNKLYTDQVYYAIGNVYLNNSQRDKAAEYYQKAIDAKKFDSYDKMKAYIKLGDMYCADKEYLKAQSCFANAARMIKNDDPEFNRVTTLAEVLNELGANNAIVQFQDTLQAIALLPEQDRIKAINTMIASIKKQEQEEAKKQQADFAAQEASASVAASALIANKNTWYFYNPAAVSAGIGQFTQQWGARQLEDNWRRSNKATQTQEFQYATATTSDTAQATADTARVEKVTDKHSPAFYLSQLPLTADARNKSNKMIGNALMNMGRIYEVKLEDSIMAIRTYSEINRRFAPDSAYLDAYYAMCRLNETRNPAEAERYKSLIINYFGDSKYAMLLQHPEYIQQELASMQAQEALYEETFMAYTQNDYATVMNNYQKVRTHYPLSQLMPKFILLNALSAGKSGSPDEMKNQLAGLIKDYPASDVATTSKDMLALVNQGKAVAQGGTYGSLFARQQAAAEAQIVEKSMQFANTLDGRHFVIMPVAGDSTVKLNTVQFRLAAFNFSHFVLKDFDLEIQKLSPNERLIIISDFNSFSDAMHYQDVLKEDSNLDNLLRSNAIYPTVISEENLRNLQAGMSLADYTSFYQSVLLPAQAAQSKNKK